ncbi:hypothetical protein GOP47_0017884 [Adiantum capillus-veneris]|uniref:Large ribosomal subunit protein uL22c n=1 Tax=Adiantum capillus-veneris TaxID=13818 RepID=A0A9D4UG92_ADICA|nr:hypothetical protein GOP47_0017884 [Adiantum capillus-veneris]
MPIVTRPCQVPNKKVLVLFSFAKGPDKKYSAVPFISLARRRGVFCVRRSQVFGCKVEQLDRSPTSTFTGLQRYQSVAGGPFGLPWQQNVFRFIYTLRGPKHSPFSSGEKVQSVPSPLTMVPTPKDQSKQAPGQVDRNRPVQAVLKKIKESPKKVNLVAALVRGMRVEDALLQLSVLQKRAAKTVQRVVFNARANATHNHGLNGDRLYVAEAFVGKGIYLKRISYHAKGRSGIMHHPSCRLTVVVKELSEKQEAEIARYKAMTFKERAKNKTPLIPHKLIETTPVWHRKLKQSSEVVEA